MNDLMKRDEQPQTTAIAPVANMSEFLALAKEFEKSGMFGCSLPGQGAVLLSTCMTDRISPIEFIRTYHLIEGRPAMRADAMLAKFVQAGGRYRITAFTAEKAEAVFSFGDNEMTMGMTMKEAEAAGLTKSKSGKIKDNWASFPRQMLWARVVSSAIRLVAPGIVAGVYTPEEAQDFDKASPPDEPVIIAASEVRLPGAADLVEKPQTAEPSAAEPSTPDPDPSSGIDPEVCPCGTIAGNRWSALDDGKLRTIYDSKHPAVKQAMTEAHYAALKAEIDKRKESSK